MALPAHLTTFFPPGPPQLDNLTTTYSPLPLQLNNLTTTYSSLPPQLDNLTDYYDYEAPRLTNLTMYYTPEVLTFTVVACGVIALTGTFGNLLAIVSLLRSTKLRRSSTYYLVNLAVSNVPVCLLGMPLMLLCSLQALLYDTILVPRGIILGIALIGFICNQAELHTICVLSFNRAVAMLKPTLYQRLIHMNGYRWILPVLWVYSAALWIPLAVGWLGELVVSDEDLFVVIKRTDSKLLRRVYLAIAFMLPLTFSSVCHGLILYKGLGLGSGLGLATADLASVQQWRSHVTKTVSLVFLLLLVLSVPHAVIHILHEKKKNLHEVWILMHILFFCRHVLDPAIFVLSSSEYRQAFVETLACLCPSIRGTTSTPHSIPLAPPTTPASRARHKIMKAPYTLTCVVYKDGQPAVTGSQDSSALDPRV